MANRYITVLASAARTALEAVVINQVSSDNPESLLFTIDVTLDAASASITPSIEGFDPLSETWTTILTGAAIAAVGDVQLRIGVGLPVTANLSANYVIPQRFRFSMAVADTDAITYSVGLEIVNK